MYSRVLASNSGVLAKTKKRGLDLGRQATHARLEMCPKCQERGFDTTSGRCIYCEYIYIGWSFRLYMLHPELRHLWWKKEGEPWEAIGKLLLTAFALWLALFLIGLWIGAPDKSHFIFNIIWTLVAIFFYTPYGSITVVGLITYAIVRRLRERKSKYAKYIPFIILTYMIFVTAVFYPFLKYELDFQSWCARHPPKGYKTTSGYHWGYWYGFLSFFFIVYGLSLLGLYESLHERRGD